VTGGAGVQATAAGACAGTGLALAAVLLAGSAEAGEWRFTPRVSATETWSDNIELEREGEERHDFVTQVSTGASVTGTGRRLQLNFDYQTTYLKSARGIDESRLDHRLQSGGNAELYEDRLFLDFSATVSQQNQDNRGRLSTDTVTANQNRQDVITVQASPYWRQRLGRVADATLRFRRSMVINSGGSNVTGAGATGVGGTDTDVDEISLSIASGPAFPRLPWTLSARLSREDNDTGTTNTFRSVDASARYQFSRRYGVRASAGFQDDQVQTADADDQSGPTLALTGIWTPTERTSVEAGIRRQAFGSSFLLDASHRMRKAVLTLGFSEDRTTSAQRQLARQLFPLTDAFGNPIPNPGLQQVGVPTDNPRISDETIITRRFDAGLSLRGRRTTGQISGFHEERSFEVSGDDETVLGLRASASRSLSPRSSASVGGSWQVSEFGDGREDTLYSVDVTYSRTLSPDLSANVSYRLQENDSSTPASSYTENRVTATVTMLF